MFIYAANATTNFWIGYYPSVGQKEVIAINIPAIQSIDHALKIYHGHSEIGNKEITYLFGKHSSATISRLKKAVKDEMIEQGIPSFSTYKVNTKIAYRLWGLDIADLEYKKKKLEELKLGT